MHFLSRFNAYYFWQTIHSCHVHNDNKSLHFLMLLYLFSKRLFQFFTPLIWYGTSDKLNGCKLFKYQGIFFHTTMKITMIIAKTRSWLHWYQYVLIENIVRWTKKNLVFLYIDLFLSELSKYYYRLIALTIIFYNFFQPIFVKMNYLPEMHLKTIPRLFCWSVYCFVWMSWSTCSCLLICRFWL